MQVLLRTASPTPRSFAAPIAPSARDGRRRTRGESEATPLNAPVARESRLCVAVPIAKTPPLAPIRPPLLGDTASAGTRRGRMTEGEGHTADIDDAAATRPSPANSHRVAAILSPLSLRPSRFFLRNEIRADRNSENL